MLVMIREHSPCGDEGTWADRGNIGKNAAEESGMVF